MEKKVNFEGLLREDGYEIPIRCSKCGKMLKYVGVGEYECEACGYTEYDAYGLVRGYLEKNPGANAVQVERATGVSQKIISFLVKQGKIEVKSRGAFFKGGSDE